MLLFVWLDWTGWTLFCFSSGFHFVQYIRSKRHLPGLALFCFVVYCFM
jgi:hypothetical protein